MKTLQNNFTTPEQSKRLLKLGVPADSADCGIVEDIMHGGIEILQVPYSEWCKGYESISLPCWSLGRLIEIELKCREKRDGYTPRLRFIYLEAPNKKDGRTLIENFVRYMTEGPYEYDFTKLDK